MVLGSSLWPWSSSSGSTSEAAHMTKLSREGSLIPPQAASDQHQSEFSDAQNEQAQGSTQERTQSPSKPAEKSLEESIATMPETMSCSQAFDLAMGCGGLGGSFNGVYRYGRWRDCSQQWADWRFCMRTRVHPEGAKKQLIREHYWEKELQMRATVSSEDVWKERETRITTFFQRDPDKDGIFEGLWARAPPELEEKE